MSGSALLHAGGFGFGDVLIVGLVLQLSTEVLDGFVQAFLQGNLFNQNQADEITLRQINKWDFENFVLGACPLNHFLNNLYAITDNEYLNP